MEPKPVGKAHPAQPPEQGALEKLRDLLRNSTDAATSEMRLAMGSPHLLENPEALGVIAEAIKGLDVPSKKAEVMENA